MKVIQSIFCDVEYEYGHQPKTNIPHVYGHANFHTWGYLGMGPTDFSQNILNHFTDGDKSFVKKFSFDFLTEVIAKLDVKASGKIPARFIHSWIKSKKNNNESNHHECRLKESGDVYWCVTRKRG